MLIALGPNTTREGRVPLSSDRIAEARETQGAGFVDNQHAALAGVGRFENVQFLETARLTPKANSRVIAKLADGSPLLVEQLMGEGRMLIFASTLDNSTNDFPLHASFLPFVVQTGHYLAGTEETAASVVAGTPVSLRHTQDNRTAADVIGPDGKHELSLNEATKALSFDLAQSGFYEVQRADGHRLLMAVHADRRESDLTTVPEETLALWRNTGNTAAEVQPGAVEHQMRPWSLWRFALMLVLSAALIESVFASRYLMRAGERKAGQHDGARTTECVFATPGIASSTVCGFARNGTRCGAGADADGRAGLDQQPLRVRASRGISAAHCVVCGTGGGDCLHFGSPAAEGESTTGDALGRAARSGVRRAPANGRRAARPSKIPLRN